MFKNSAILLLVLVLSASCSTKREVAVDVDDADACLAALNLRLSSVKSIYCPSIRTGVLSRSSISYRKPNSISFSSYFAENREAMVFCDENTYWFWIKSFNKDAVYYCDPNDLEKTRLRAVMRPETMACAAWVDELRPESKLIRTERGFVAKCSDGKRTRLVEFDSQKILSQTVILDGTPLVSMEGDDFSDYSGVMLPNRIVVTWHEEGHSATFRAEGWCPNKEGPEISEPKGLKRINLSDL